MKKERLVKGCTAVLAAACLLFSGFRRAEVDAAEGIETGKTDCSITIQVEGNLKFGKGGPGDGSAPEKELAEQAEADLKNPAEGIRVSLYRTAEIAAGRDGNYVYRAIEEFSENHAYEEALKGLDDQTTAENWRDYAELAAQTAGILAETPADEDTVEVDLTNEGALRAYRTVLLENGKAEITGLPTGLYLVAAGRTHDKDYEREYSFAPYLISLPDNRFAPGEEDSTDAWLYQVTAGLKPQIGRLYGDLHITKRLSEKNRLEGAEGATSVFHVVVTDGEGDGRKEIYNNMVAFRLRETGETDTVVIGKFPAGAVASVTEVYAGAGYEAEGSPAREDIVIISDEAVERTGALVAAADFTNRTDGTIVGGYGIVNHFTDGVKTVDDVRKESSAEVENKTAYPEGERPGSGMETEKRPDGDAGPDTRTVTE